MLALGFVVGTACGFASVGFRALINLIQTATFGVPEGNNFLGHVNNLAWYYRLALPAAGGLLVGPVVHFLVQEARGTGVPEVIESIVTRAGSIRWRVIPLKTLVSSLTIGTGGSAGREGPIVQIGSTIGSAVGDFLNLTQTKVKTLIGCGAAGGIAGTFNTPLGGVIFSLEVLLEDFHVSQFTSIVVSSVISTAICQRFLGTHPAFMIPTYTAELWELVPYALLGLLCGLLALLFTNTLYTVDDLFEGLNHLPDYLKPAVGGLLVGLIALAIPYVYGVGYYIVEGILKNELSLMLVLLLMLSKGLATTITVSSGGSGGVFAPSLFIGATIGSSFGKIINIYVPTVSVMPGSYALVGMGAFVAGTIHAPMTAVVLLFEMTRDYTIILPLMFACIFSTALSQSFQKYNIYTLKLFRRGLDIQAGKETNILQQIRVDSAMKTDVQYVRESDGIDRLKSAFGESHHTHYPVVKNEGKEVIGVINYTRHWDFLEEEHPSPLIICRDLARTPPVTVTADDNLLTALEKITDFHVEVLPVVDDEKNLVGILSRNDIINAYNRKLRERRHPT